MVVRLKRYVESQIEELVEILKNDGVISVPTDTVYGICARVSSQKAYDKLFHIKNRSSNKIFPVMCASSEQIKSIAQVDERIEKLMCAFMPGPVTLVLNKKREALSYINNRGSEEFHELAVRVAPTEVLKQLINMVGSPLFMTSANQSGEPVCQTLEDIEKAFPDLDGILEGDVSFSKASTIIDCTSRDVIIQRQGPISMEQILEVLREV